MSAMEIENLSTVQGVGSPVPASSVGERAGPATSTSSNRNVLGVDHLAPSAQSTTSEEREDGRIMKIKESEDEKLQICNLILQKMKAAVKRQTNVSMDIKKGVAELEEALDAIAILRDSLKKAEAAIKYSPDLRNSTEKAETNRKKRGASSSPAKNIGKKNKVRAPKTPGAMVSMKYNLDKPVEKSKTKSKTKPDRVIEKTNQKEMTKSRRKAKSEAILIKPVAGKSYSEILGSIRKETNPDLHKEEIKSIRKTKAGDVLLELGIRTTDERSTLSDTLRTILGESATIQQLEPKKYLEIRDLDSVTTEEEVEIAIKASFKELSSPLKVTLLDANKREVKLAIVQLSEKDANEMLETRRLKVGWVNCRVRERVEVPRCFKCLGYGHFARNCVGPDRSKLCYKCGSDDHKAKECVNKPRCMLCEEVDAGKNNLDHIPGSGKCRIFREALKVAKKRLL